MDTIGLIVIVVTLTLASLFAWYRKRSDGQFRNVTRAAVDPTPTKGTNASPEQQLANLVQADDQSGNGPTFIQFSGQFCAQCRRNETVFRHLERTRDDFRFVEIAVEDHDQLSSRLKIRRTPTIFLLDTNGTVLARTEGAVTARSLSQTIDNHTIGERQ